MKKVAIVIDDWKLEIFKKILDFILNLTVCVLLMATAITFQKYIYESKTHLWMFFAGGLWANYFQWRKSK